MWLCLKISIFYKIEKKIQHDSTIIEDAILIQLQEFCMGYAATLMGSGGFHSSGFTHRINNVINVQNPFSLPRKDQRRALFEHRKTCSDNGVFLALLTLKCASHAHLNFEKCSEHEVFLCVVFGILTSKCASCHNGVQFFISHLTRWLRTRRFSEPTCRPSGATKHWKNEVFRDFSTFSRTWVFFLLASSHLCLSICPYSRKFDS